MAAETAPHLEVLTRQECLQLLAGSPIGWLVYSTPLRPRMVMVNIALRGAEVLVRTGPGEAQLSADNGLVMTIGVGSTDEATRTGWSVTVTGTARLLGPLVEAGDAPLQPWAPGLKDHVLAVPTEDVTGRRIRAGSPLGTGEAAWGWWG